MAQKIKKLLNDKLPIIIPMGAIKPNEQELQVAMDSEDYYAELKYDGCRYLSHYRHDKVRFTSRSVSVKTLLPTEKTDNLPHLRDMKNDIFDSILDGEIYIPGLTSHDVTSITGGLPETAIANQKERGYVHYIIYDILAYKGKDVRKTPYLQRRIMLENIVMHILEQNPQLQGRVYCSKLLGNKNKREIYDEVLAAGGEGMILKHKDSFYYEGEIRDGKGIPAKVKANKKKGIPFTPWIKAKKHELVDVVIMGFEPAEIDYTGKDEDTCGYWMNKLTNKKWEAFDLLEELEMDIGTDYSEFRKFDYIPITKFHYFGWPGSVIFGQYNKKGELVQVGYTSGIKDELRKKFAENPDDYIGRVAMVECMEVIKKTGALREPRFIDFHPDKNDFECVIDI